MSITLNLGWWMLPALLALGFFVVAIVELIMQGLTVPKYQSLRIALGLSAATALTLLARYL